MVMGNGSKVGISGVYRSSVGLAIVMQGMPLLLLLLLVPLLVHTRLAVSERTLPIRNALPKYVISPINSWFCPFY